MTRALALSLCLATAACSGGGSSDGGTDGGAAGRLPSMAPAAACTQLASALGALEVRCQRMAASDEPAWAAAYCDGAFQTQQGLYDAGLLAYDPSAVACEANFRKTQPCNLSPTAPSGCGQLAWGLLTVGDSCGDPDSCQDGEYCSRPVAGLACGSCTADPTEGAPCGPAASNAPCAGSACDGATCQEQVGIGQECGEESTVCAPLLTCNGQGFCEEAGGVDTSCGSDGDCQDGLYCDPNLVQCLFLKADGGACPTGAGCPAGFVCAPAPGAAPDGGSPLVCQPVFPGGPCLFGFCLEAETCVDGGCVPEPGMGQPCAAGEPCLAGACLGGLCQELGAGQPCQGGPQCMTGLCGGAGSSLVCAGLCVM